MSDPTYAPFPQAELEKIETECQKLLEFIRDGELRVRIVQRAGVCRDAVAAHHALRDRCLLAELNLRSAEALLQATGTPFRRAEVAAEDSHAA